MSSLAISSPVGIFQTPLPAMQLHRTLELECFGDELPTSLTSIGFEWSLLNGSGVLPTRKRRESGHRVTCTFQRPVLLLDHEHLLLPAIEYKGPHPHLRSVADRTNCVRSNTSGETAAKPGEATAAQLRRTW